MLANKLRPEKVKHGRLGSPSEYEVDEELDSPGLTSKGPSEVENISMMRNDHGWPKHA